MAEFSFSKSLLGNKKGGADRQPCRLRAVRVDLLLGRRADAQHADPRPGVFERLMQAQDASRPQVDISLAVVPSLV